MASRIQGITIEINGETTGLAKALKGIDGQLKESQKSLKDIDKLLKLNPASTELLTQKQRQLETAIKGTKDRLTELKNAQSQVEQGTDEWDRLQREIIATEQNLKQLEQQYRDFGSVAAQQIAVVGQKMQDVGSGIEKAGKAFAPVSTAAGGALTAIGGLAYKSVVAADDLNTLSKQTGISTDELQKMQYAADLVDVSVDDITGALRKMKTRMDESNETFAALGVSVVNADGSLRDATDVFYDSIKALSGIDNETERDKVAMELFGKSADSLAGIIDDGGAALKGYGDEAENLGLIMSGDTLNALNEVNDTIDRSKAVIGASFAEFGATAAEVLAPAIEKVAGVLDTVTEKLRNLTPEQTETIMKILGVVAAVAPLLTMGGKLISGIGKVLTIAPKIATAAKLVAGVISPGAIGITALIAAVAALTVFVIKHWDEIKEGVGKAVEAVKTAVKTAWENMKSAISSVMTGIKDRVTEIWTNIKTAVQSTVDGIRTGVTTAWENVKTGVSDTVEGLKEKVSSAWDGIKEKISSVVDSVKRKIDDLKEKFNAVRDTISRIWDSIVGFFRGSIPTPHVPLPHFQIYPPGWRLRDLLHGSIPSLGISWYKKAYDNPVMFTSPTVLQTPGGYKGFGDGHGAEIVMGLDKLRQLVGASEGVIINVYGAPGQDINELADAIQQRLVALQKQREVAYA